MDKGLWTIKKIIIKLLGATVLSQVFEKENQEEREKLFIKQIAKRLSFAECSNSS